MQQRVVKRSLVLLAFGAVTALALAILPRLATAGLVSTASLDEFGGVRESVGVNRRLFPQPPGALVAIRSPSPVPPPGLLGAIRDLDTALAARPSVRTVTSVASLSDIVDTGSELDEVPLLPARRPLTNDDAAELVALLERNAFLANVVRSPDGLVWNVAVALEPGVDLAASFDELERVARGALDAAPYDYRLLGPEWVDHRVEARIPADLARLGSLGVLIVLLCFLAVSRRPGTTVAMGAAVLVPTVWTVALFPLVDNALTVVGLIVPFQAIALATSYSIHVHRFAVTAEVPDWTGSARRATPVVVFAAATSAAGFASLAVGRTPVLRELSLHFVFAVTAAAAAALLLLPCLATRPRRVGAGSRFPVVPLPVGVAALAVSLLLALGIPRITPNNAASLWFTGRSSIGRDFSFARAHYGGDDELHLLLAIDAPEGFAAIERYRAVRDLTGALAAHDGVGSAVAYTLPVAWLNGRLEGRRADVEPESTAEVGECLELLGSIGSGSARAAYLTDDFRTARIVVRIGREGSAAPDRVALVRALERETRSLLARRDPGIRVSASGPAIVAYDTARNMYRDALRSVAIFAPVAFVLLALVTRSAGTGLILILPAVLGATAALGTVGWAGVAANGATALIVATLLGVGVDDAIFLTIVYRRYRLAGLEPDRAMRVAYADVAPAAVQTSLVLALGVLPMLLSPYAFLAHAAAVLALGLLVALAMTLGLLPALLRRIDHPGATLVARTEESP